jgi:hypothetical protein
MKAEEALASEERVTAGMALKVKHCLSWNDEVRTGLGRTE